MGDLEDDTIIFSTLKSFKSLISRPERSVLESEASYGRSDLQKLYTQRVEVRHAALLLMFLSLLNIHTSVSGRSTQASSSACTLSRLISFHKVTFNLNRHNNGEELLFFSKLINISDNRDNIFRILQTSLMLRITHCYWCLSSYFVLLSVFE